MQLFIIIIININNNGYTILRCPCYSVIIHI